MSHQAPSYDDEKRGVLFKNDKGDNERRPDYRGKATLEGKEYKLSAWIREPKSGGAKFMSITFEPADAPREQAAAERVAAALDDEIPF
jgi:hypothetical protein